MKFSTNSRNRKLIRTVTAVVLVSGSLAMPMPASARMLDAIHDKVNSIRAQVGQIVDGMRETRGAFRSGGAREMLNSVRATLLFLKESREQFQYFRGSNDCDVGSPCDAYREKLHDLIDDITELPQELPFVDNSSSRKNPLENAHTLIDRIPTFVLYASANTIGDAIDNVLERTGTLRSVVAELPELPTLYELNTMNDLAICETVPKNPHIALVGVVLDNLAGTLSDMAGFMQDNITVGVTAVGGGTVSIKNPTKFTFQIMAFRFKTWKRKLAFKQALVTSTCAIAGFDV